MNSLIIRNCLTYNKDFIVDFVGESSVPGKII